MAPDFDQVKTASYWVPFPSRPTGTMKRLSNVMLGPGATYTAAYRLTQEDAVNCTVGTCTFSLQNFTGSGTNATDIQNWVTSTKSNTTGGNIVSVSIGGGFQTTASCPTPP